MSQLKFAKIYIFKYFKISIFISLIFFSSKGYLQAKEKSYGSGLLESEKTTLFEENLASEIYIITREKSPLLIQNTRPIKQQFNEKVFITIGGEDGNLFYAKEVEENSNLWHIDWINLPDFKKPKGGKNKNSNTYKATINIKNFFGDIEKINLFIDVVDVIDLIDIAKNTQSDSTDKSSFISENKAISIENKLEGISIPIDNSLRKDESTIYYESKKRLLNEEQPLTSELKIVTKEHSPLLIQNKLPIKQEFNNKVLISIGGDDGKLFYAKEVEDDSNLWLIDWINQPDFEKPLGGINNNSNNYKASINIKDVSGDVKTIKLFVDVVDIDENLKKALKKSDNKVDGKILNTYSEIPRKRSKLFSQNELTSGLAEKGGYLGIAKNIGKKNQFEIGYNYLNIDISRFFTTNSDVKIKNSSFRIALRRFLNKNINKNGFYVEGSGDLAKINVYSSYSLTNENSTYGSLSVSCSACGNLYINSKEKLNFIPSFSMGYRKKISKRITFDLRAGVQYLEEIPEFTWKAIQKDGSTYYPPFIYSRIEDEANEEINSLNKKIKELPKIIPTIGINFVYRF